MASFEVSEHKNPYSLRHCKTSILTIQSRSLKGNPLKDPTERPNYVLSPLGDKAGLPVVFHLSGYFSTGYQSFHSRSLEKNMVQSIDEFTGKGRVPQAHHVFVDAMTAFGGSQFINSPGQGRYSDYILKELCPAVQEAYSTHSKKWCALGASSGGYGALHLISQPSTPFSLAAAVAPDSFFEASLLPELFQMAPQIREYKSLAEIKKLMDAGELQEKRHFFPLMNVLAMALSYSPSSALQGKMIKLPVDLETGEVQSKLWKSWLEKDPTRFLNKRKAALKGKTIYLDVGKYDNYSLQFGTRQIAKLLKKQKVKTIYGEFSGTHRGLSKRRLIALQWLKKVW